MRRWLLSGVLLGGCPAPADGTTGGDDGSGGTSASSTGVGPATDTGGADESTGSDGSTAGGAIECDVFGGDCPAGEKCLPWAPSAEDLYVGTRCAPAGDHAEGDPCTVEDHPRSGIDDCVAEAVCWFVDPDTLQGECIRRCESDTVDSGCDLPCNGMCTIGSELAPPLCLPPCNPLVQDCDPGFTCVAADTHFVCVLDRSGPTGAIGDSCTDIDTCDPGLFCLSALAWPDCNGPGGCCAPACTLDDPDACTEAPPEVECVPWYGGTNTPANTMCTPFDQIGVCALP